jgi:3-methyl-2-oxobutanoate hydroxymethyltransferase
MLYHVRIVARTVKRPLVVADMPFLSYQVNADEALRNAGRFLKEAGAEAVKIEGGAHVLETVRRLAAVGIPVMGHLGLTPQSIHLFGTYRTRGSDPEEAAEIRADARALAEAGACAVVLEKIPSALATEITRELEIPTIGIGAGPLVDGQVLVLYDMLGLNDGFRPRFLRTFASLADCTRKGIADYVQAVRDGSYPDAEHSFE